MRGNPEGNEKSSIRMEIQEKVKIVEKCLRLCVTETVKCFGKSKRKRVFIQLER